MSKSGVVASFSRAKKTGFIIPDDGGTNVFVHWTEILREGQFLNAGEAVWYQEGWNTMVNKPCAQQVTLAHGVNGGCHIAYDGSYASHEILGRTHYDTVRSKGRKDPKWLPEHGRCRDVTEHDRGRLGGDGFRDTPAHAGLYNPKKIELSSLSSFASCNAASSVAWWADSTYAYMGDAVAFKIAADRGFPLKNFVCTYGAGLATDGQETMDAYKVAKTIIVEMGYNDKHDMSRDEAVRNIRRQAWFKALSARKHEVLKVIFVRQPGYFQLASTSKRNKTFNYRYGDFVHGSVWTDDAFKLVEEELGVRATIFEKPAIEFFVGMVEYPSADGQSKETWQDHAKCKTTSKGEQYFDKDGKEAVWIDALHPGNAAAKQHFEMLLESLASQL